MLAVDYFCTPIALFATRPGSGDLSSFEEGAEGNDELPNEIPDLIMGTLLKGGAHLLKSDTIYELVMNDMTGVIELREKGRSIIGKKWFRNYYEIPTHFGNTIWLTREEYKKHQAKSGNGI